MLKQALDSLKKAENDAEQLVASAKVRALEIRKAAEQKKAAMDEEKVESAKCESVSLLARYKAEADAIIAEAETESMKQAKAIDRIADANKGKALNKAVERIVRKNGHR